MKITEIITEAQLPKDHIAATPGMKIHKELQSSDPYDAYKFGVNLGGSPEFHHPADLDGPAGQALVTVAYTEACEEIIDATEKAHNVKSKRISPRGSQEATDVHKVSPHRQVGAITLNKKK